MNISTYLIEVNHMHDSTFSVPFTKLEKVTISFVVCFCLSVCLSLSLSFHMERLRSNWMDLHEI